MQSPAIAEAESAAAVAGAGAGGAGVGVGAAVARAVESVVERTAWSPISSGWRYDSPGRASGAALGEGGDEVSTIRLGWGAGCLAARWDYGGFVSAVVFCLNVGGDGWACSTCQTVRFECFVLAPGRLDAVRGPDVA